MRPAYKKYIKKKVNKNKNFHIVLEDTLDYFKYYPLSFERYSGIVVASVSFQEKEKSDQAYCIFSIDVS